VKHTHIKPQQEHSNHSALRDRLHLNYTKKKQMAEMRTQLSMVRILNVFFAIFQLSSGKVFIFLDTNLL